MTNFQSFVLALGFLFADATSLFANSRDYLAPTDLEAILKDTTQAEIIGLGDVFHTSGGLAL